MRPRLKADGAGIANSLRRRDVSRQHAADAMLKRVGPRPETQTALPLRASTCATDSSNGLLQGRAEPRIRGAASARWRAPRTLRPRFLSSDRRRHSGPRCRPRRFRQWTARRFRRSRYVSVAARHDSACSHSWRHDRGPASWRLSSRAAPTSSRPMSLAGRTALPAAQPVAVRAADSAVPTACRLLAYRADRSLGGWRRTRTAHVISVNAVTAARQAGVLILALRRPAWQPLAG